MILVDVNILIYATDNSSERHDAARKWLDAQLGGSVAVGLPWHTVLAFLRLATNPRIYPHPLTVLEAGEGMA